MTTAMKSLRVKINTLFTELIGERSIRVTSMESMGPIESSLTNSLGAEKAHEIAFHLSDWGFDAAFILAMHLYPERFTPEEIAEGVLAFVIHVPNHVAAAAHLHGWPIRAVFYVGLELDKS